MNRREKLIQIFCMLFGEKQPESLEQCYESISYHLQLLDEQPKITNEDRKLIGEITAISLILLQKDLANEGKEFIPTGNKIMDDMMSKMLDAVPKNYRVQHNKGNVKQ